MLLLPLKKQITTKAMILRYQYQKTFFHSLEDLKKDPLYGYMWDNLDNFNRAYVLKGLKGKKKNANI